MYAERSEKEGNWAFFERLFGFTFLNLEYIMTNAPLEKVEKGENYETIRTDWKAAFKAGSRVTA